MLQDSNITLYGVVDFIVCKVANAVLRHSKTQICQGPANIQRTEGSYTDIGQRHQFAVKVHPLHPLSYFH